MTQAFIALFGLTAIWLATGHNPTGRKWAPVIGLCGQPFWAFFAYQTNAWGLAALVAAYTLVYLRGTLVQWADPQKTKTRCVNSGLSDHSHTQGNGHDC